MTFTIWMTGLSGSGKTTIANELATRYHWNKQPLMRIDGDDVRTLINRDLKYSLEEREEHLRRIIGICVLANQSYVPTVVSTISPTEKIREMARSSLENCILVYVKCPLDVCKQRDPKQLYRKKTSSMVGIDIPYEEPKDADIIIDSEKESPNDAVEKILNYILEL